MKLVIFSSSRAVKAYYEERKSQNALLDKALSVDEFFELLLFCKDKRKASSYESLLCMQKACLECKKSEEVLKIKSDFFAFLKNYDYLFSFFKELCLAKKSIKDLQNSDSYALYDEHLEILDELLKIYFEKLENAGLYDELSLISNYSLNWDFLKNFHSLIFNLDGFLNAFEEELLSQISKQIDTQIIFKTSKFNIDFFSNLNFFKNFELEKDKIYTLNLSQNTLIQSADFNYKAKSLKLKNFELRSLQASFVFDEISNFLNKDIKAENIVVIAPDEEFCELLRLFDKNKMLNFASGISIKESLFYKRFKALFNALKDEAFVEDKRSKEEYFEDKNTRFDFHNTALKSFEIKDYQRLKELFLHKTDFSFFEDYIKKLLESENIELYNKIEKELFFIKSLLKNQNLRLCELFELFLIQINHLKFSHTSGGVVRVLGILESRNLSFDGVIIVDFNDEFIPKYSINSMFLNDNVRKKAGLISFENRLNLQRFYYESVIKNARQISISYVLNEESMKSRLLNELDLEFKEDFTYTQGAYLKALSLDYIPRSIDLTPLKAPKFHYDLFKTPLSNTRFENFLKFKRSYFYQYILNIKEARALSLEISAKDKGEFLHQLLEKYYKNSTSKNHFDYENFILLLDKELENKPFSRLEKKILKLQFKAFSKCENMHFQRGFEIFELEKEYLRNNAKDFMLKNDVQIKLEGKIDRIDKNILDNSFIILDYKSGKVPRDSFQLAFYEAIFAKEAKAFYYDLNEAKLVSANKNHTLEQLKTKLEEIYEEDETLFENEKKNEHCVYKLIYEKDLK